MKIPRDLKAKINRLAHNAGLAHGERVKVMLSDEVKRRLTAGESFAEITTYLENTDPPQCRTSDHRHIA